MRNWQLTSADPLSLCLAADARQFHTDYADDQIWELIIGEEQSPALVLETRYGGRCGLARLVPMWVVDRQVVYEASAYGRKPVLHTFWPSYLRLSAQPTPALSVLVEVWAMTSHAIGGRFTLRNLGDRPLEAGADLFAQIMTEQQSGKVNIVTLDSGQYALHLPDVGNLQPVILMHAVRASSSPSPKLAARLSLPPGEQAAIRWVHAARPSLSESLALADHWLYQEDWNSHLERLREINAATPEIETGDSARDATIAMSYRVVLGGLVGPVAGAAGPALVLARTPGRGYSPRGDGSDHPDTWRGAAADELYLALTALAPAAPELAQGILRQILALASPDGFVDVRPGPGGQRSGLLSLPLLASTAWQVHTYSGNLAFLREVFPALVRFFERWFAPDMDRDGDGLPEWQSVVQSAFPGNPVFAPILRGAQNADIRTAEAPDLAALLAGEARSLLLMADLLNAKTAMASLQQRLDGLLAHLDALWNAATGVYHYRDRDAHVTAPGLLVVEGPGDQTLLPALDLQPANRLIVRVEGGRDHRPAMRLTLEGGGADGRAIVETLEAGDFLWHRGFGAATTAGIFARVDRVIPEGLSRVYTVQVRSVDWTRQNAALLLPLWAGAGDPDRRARLIATMTDPTRYWRPYGISVIPADDPAFDPAQRDGIGGAWPLWNTLLGEALIDAGRPDLAAQLLERLLAARTHTLTTEKAFRAGYNSDAPEGLGERNHISGIAPLYLLWRLMGFVILSPRRVAIGGMYALPWPVRVRQHGVTVQRSADGAIITFASGTKRRVRSARWQIVVDNATPEPSESAAGRYRPTPPPGPRQRKGSNGRQQVSVRVRPHKPDRSDPFT